MLTRSTAIKAYAVNREEGRSGGEEFSTGIEILFWRETELSA